MNHKTWMLEAERLMNLMEKYPYKSEQYLLCKKALLAHLARKPGGEEPGEQDAGPEPWTMTGPTPLAE